MFEPNELLFWLAFSYALFLLLISVVLSFKKIHFPQNPNYKLVFIFVLAFLLRLLPAFFFPFASKHDFQAFIWAAGTVIRKENLYYSVDVRHNYAFFPSFALLTSLAVLLSQKINLSLLFLAKIPLAFFDAAVAAFIFIMGKNFKNALLYAVSPVGVIIACYLGQFDCITIFFALLAFYFFSRRKDLLTCLFLGLATTFKPWTVMFLPLILFRQKKFNQVLICTTTFILPLVIVSLFYKLLIPSANLLFMIGAIILYDSVGGWWGLSLILEKLACFLKTQRSLNLPVSLTYNNKTLTLNLIFQIPKVLIINLILFIFHFSKRTNPFILAKKAILIIYVFSFGLSAHYLLWIFPFALLTRDSFIKFYLILTGVYFILFGILGGLDYKFQSAISSPVCQSNICFNTLVIDVFMDGKRNKVFKKILHNPIQI